MNIPKPSGRGFRPLFIAIPLLALALGGVAFWLFSRDSGTEESPLPTASESTTPLPEIKNLGQLFDIPTEAIPIVVSAEPLVDFLSQREKVIIQPGEMRKIRAAGETNEIGILDLIERFSIEHPGNLKNYLGAEKLTAIYGQIEVFNETGVSGVATGQKKFIFVSEVTDKVAVGEVLKGWETTIERNLAPLFGLSVGKAKEKTFLDTTYQGVQVRYKNFPFPDKTIDYALVEASNKKIYLVITNSRESMWVAIDKLH